MKTQKNWKGFIGMEKVREILRLEALGLSKVQIALSCRTSRQVVREYIGIARANGITHARLDGISENELLALFGKKKAGRRVKAQPIDYEYIKRELPRPGVTMYLLWEEYRRNNFDGYSYSHYCTLYQIWRDKLGMTMRLPHKGGEKLFVDYSGLKVAIVNPKTGEVSQAEIFVAALGASNCTFVEASESQDSLHWIGSHIRAFEYFGGVPEVVVPDNLKSGVTAANYYEPGINRVYQELAEFYGFAVLPARSKHPRDKAKVEEAVQNVERRILARLRDREFHSIAELNEAIKPLLEEINHREQQQYGRSRWQMFEQLDKPALRALPSRRFEIASWKRAKVNIDYHVEFKRHYYSVPFGLVHTEVHLRVTEHMVEALHDGKRVAIHRRDDTCGGFSTLKEHMPQAHQFMSDWSPSRLINWAEKIGPATVDQISMKLNSRLHPEQSYRASLGLLSLAKKYGNQRLEAACQMVNSFGAVPLSSIKNILKNGSDLLKTQTQSHKPVVHNNLRDIKDFH